jgi:hypothetical protein
MSNTYRQWDAQTQSYIDYKKGMTSDEKLEYIRRVIYELMDGEPEDRYASEYRLVLQDILYTIEKVNPLYSEAEIESGILNEDVHEI